MGMLFVSQVVRIPETTDETYDALFQFSKELGKVPVACKVRFSVLIHVFYITSYYGQLTCDQI